MENSKEDSDKISENFNGYFSSNFISKTDSDNDSNFKKDNLKIEYKKRTIIGFDPGLTVGIAIIDLNGHILSLKSFKEAKYSEVVREIISHGRAIIVASDVYPPPKMVKKLATSLNAKIDSPSSVFTVGSKKEMVDGFLRDRKSNFSPNNAHQRDALAAAIKTYKNYEKKFNQIDKRGKKKNLSFKEREEVKTLFINGMPITKALDFINDSKVTIKSEKSNFDNILVSDLKTGLDSNSDSNLDYQETLIKLKRRINQQESQIKNQDAIIKNLRGKNKLLKNKIRKQKKKSSKLKFKLEKLQQDYSKEILLEKKVSSKINIIKKLQMTYNNEKVLREKLEEKLKTFNKIKTIEVSDKTVPVKIIKSFTRDGINESYHQGDLKSGDAVFILNSRGGGSQTASLLSKLSLKAIIVSDEMPPQAKKVLENKDIPIIKSSKIGIKMGKDFAIVQSETLDKEIQLWKNKIKKQRNQDEKEKLWNVIDEYRAKRKRDSQE
ncbi:MAG: DUF460 domain-containing protein [Methanobacteriaceae archaeon]|nr:DUF460 domain-containing protein [Methanobacteriaceae archaeon]MDP3485113.1 DUF460 domain-containing protein [Methanobacteriaceae archaeon]MDP3624931.1 DUF460 domain-containing protein [Methanobacteriaceae archaeon]